MWKGWFLCCCLPFRASSHEFLTYKPDCWEYWWNWLCLAWKIWMTKRAKTEKTWSGFGLTVVPVVAFICTKAGEIDSQSLSLVNWNILEPHFYSLIHQLVLWLPWSVLNTSVTMFFGGGRRALFKVSRKWVKQKEWFHFTVLDNKHHNRLNKWLWKRRSRQTETQLALSTFLKSTAVKFNLSGTSGGVLPIWCWAQSWILHMPHMVTCKWHWGWGDYIVTLSGQQTKRF